MLCDEAYRWIEVPGGDPFAPPAVDYGPSAISVGTISKPFGLPGLRIGWMAASAEVVTECWSMRDYTSLSLLIDIENREARVAAPDPPRDLTWMWKELGLKRP